MGMLGHFFRVNPWPTRFALILSTNTGPVELGMMGNCFKVNPCPTPLALILAFFIQYEAARGSMSPMPCSSGLFNPEYCVIESITSRF